MKINPKIIVYFLIIILSIVVLGGIIMIQFLKHKNKELSQKYKIPYPAIMAHRGLSYFAPEETRPAYLMALEIGEDLYLEADIQRTKDGVLVCFHDDDLKRTTNINEIFPDKVNSGIGDLTYQELLKLDLGTWFNKKYPERARESFVGLKIFTLEELANLAKTKPNHGLYLETKSAHKYPGIEKELVLLLYKMGWIDESAISSELLNEIKSNPLYKSVISNNKNSKYERVIFQSFEIESLKLLQKYAPGVPRVFLVDEDMQREHGSYKKLIEMANSVDAHLGPSGYMGYPWNNYKALKQNIITHHYTINKEYQIKILELFGSGGFFTDKANMVLELYYPEKYKNINIKELFKKINY